MERKIVICFFFTVAVIYASQTPAKRYRKRQQYDGQQHDYPDPATKRKKPSQGNVPFAKYMQPTGHYVESNPQWEAELQSFPNPQDPQRTNSSTHHQDEMPDMTQKDGVSGQNPVLGTPLIPYQPQRLAPPRSFSVQPGFKHSTAALRTPTQTAYMAPPPMPPTVSSHRTSRQNTHFAPMAPTVASFDQNTSASYDYNFPHTQSSSRSSSRIPALEPEAYSQQYTETIGSYANAHHYVESNPHWEAQPQSFPNAQGPRRTNSSTHHQGQMPNITQKGGLSGQNPVPRTQHMRSHTPLISYPPQQLQRNKDPPRSFSVHPGFKKSTAALRTLIQTAYIAPPPIPFYDYGHHVAVKSKETLDDVEEDLELNIRRQINNYRDLPDHFKNQINDRNVLGKGTFATVYNVSILPNEIHAMKCSIADIQLIDLLEYIREIALLRSLSHSNIIKIHENHIYKGEKNQVCYVLDKAPFGNLTDLIGKINFNYSPSKRFLELLELLAPHLLLEVGEGLQAIHNIGYAHRDVKPDNIVVSRHLKLIDFGHSRQYVRDMNDGEDRRLGTRYFVPPEYALPDDKHYERVFDNRGDLWALGVILYKFMSNKFPFTDSKRHELYKKIRKLEFRKIDGMSDEFNRVLNKLLAYLPQRYQWASELLADPYLERAQQYKATTDSSHLWEYLYNGKPLDLIIDEITMTKKFK